MQNTSNAFQVMFLIDDCCWCRFWLDFSFVVFLWLSLALKSLPFFQLNYDVIFNVYDVINLEEGEEGRKDYWMREEFDISIWKVWLYSVSSAGRLARQTSFHLEELSLKLNTLSTQITNKFWLVVWINVSKDRASVFSCKGIWNDLWNKEKNL